MNKKCKKILCIVSVIALILILASLISIHIYKENNRVIFSYDPVKLSSDGSYMYSLGYAHSGKVSERTQNHLNEISADCNKYIKSFEEKYEAPYKVNVTLSTEKGKTVVKYTGTATNIATKTDEKINDIFEYNFFISDEVVEAKKSS